MLDILQLIRWKNLLLIVLTQSLIKFSLFPYYKVDVVLANFQFMLLLLATLFLAAAGNIVNDIYDVVADSVNRPKRVLVEKKISEKTAFNLFVIFNILGVGLGFYLANDIGKSSFATLFVIISALLYVYSTYLKQLVLIGNIIISILVTCSILIVGLFDLTPTLNSFNRELHIGTFQILLVYSAFAFLFNLVREIVKDIEDINGDYKVGIKTLPIVIGRERSTNIAFLLSLLPIFTLIYIIIEKLYQYQITMAYLLLFVVGPSIYVSVKLYKSHSKKEFHKISQAIKLVMFFGVLSLLLFQLNINNA